MKSKFSHRPPRRKCPKFWAVNNSIMNRQTVGGKSEQEFAELGATVRDERNPIH
jgi:hypothetical protein